MKKVLVICYYWPPAGGPGVQRWLKFAGYLPDFGIDPILFVPDNPSYPIIDANLEAPANIKVIRTKIFEPYALASAVTGTKSAKMSSGIIPEKSKQGFAERLALWIRGNLFIPDARVFWVRPSVKYLSRYVRENQIDTVITTGPPHSLHLIGLGLKNKNGIKWLADFRDPWTTIGYHKSLKLTRRSAQQHKTLEREVLNAADQIIVTSPTTKAEFEQITSKPIAVITNGHDLKPVAVAALDKKFSIAHIGSLLSGRNPLTLWEALSELVAEKPKFAESLELKMIGTVSSDVLRSIESVGLADYLTIAGYVSHEKAVEFQRSSQVLLLIEIDSNDTRSIIPGKLFEYMVSGRPVLAIGPERSDMQPIVEETQIGIFATHLQKDLIKSTLSFWHDAYLSGKLAASPHNTGKYHRRNLTKDLAELILSL